MTIQVIRDDCFNVDWSNLEGKVDLIIVDPPYGGIVDEKWDKEWTAAWYFRLGDLIYSLLKPYGTAYVWGGVGTYTNRPFFNWLSELESSSNKLVLHNLITWSKKRAYGKKDNYLFTREECAMLVRGAKPATFNIPLLDVKRGYAGYKSDVLAGYPAKSEFLRRTNVWTDVTELFRGKIHPTEKPSRLAEIMIETSSNMGDFIVDMMAGSGSTGVAAKKLGRDCLLVERSECAMHDF